MKSGATKGKKKPKESFKVIDGVLRQICGEATALCIYKYLDEKHSLKREDIPDEPKLFKEALARFLGEPGASLVFRTILNEGYSMKLERVLWIYDPVEQRTEVAMY